MKRIAVTLQARPGWYFLTGSKENVEAALQKLGQKVDNREAHQNLFLIGGAGVLPAPYFFCEQDCGTLN